MVQKFVWTLTNRNGGSEMTFQTGKAMADHLKCAYRDVSRWLQFPAKAPGGITIRRRKVTENETPSERLKRLGYRLDADAGKIITPDGVEHTVVGTKGYLVIGKVYHHRVLWESARGAIPPDMEIDHINRDRLDNRIANLRVVTRHQNAQNKGSQSNTVAKLKGVVLHRGKFVARINFNGKRHYLGRFTTAQEAHDAYRRKAEEFNELHDATFSW